MTKEALLKASIEAFKDKDCELKATPYKKVLTKDGYTFIIKDEKNAKKISASIHLNTEWNVNNRKGFIRERTFQIATREAISTNYILEYQGMIIFLFSFSGYNPNLKQYMYLGEMMTDDQLKLVDYSNLDDSNFGYSAFERLVNIPNFAILPQYYSANDFKSGVIFLDTESTEEGSLIRQDLDGLNQLVFEDVVFNIFNYTRKEVMTFAYALQNFSLTENTFGIASQIKLEQIKEVTNASALNSISYKIAVRLCYNMNVEQAQESEKYIKSIVWCMKLAN